MLSNKIQPVFYEGFIRTFQNKLWNRSKSLVVRDDQKRGTLSHFKYSANIQLGHVNDSPY